jgi:hypothetical protein
LKIESLPADKGRLKVESGSWKLRTAGIILCFFAFKNSLLPSAAVVGLMTNNLARVQRIEKPYRPFTSAVGDNTNGGIPDKRRTTGLFFFYN